MNRVDFIVLFCGYCVLIFVGGIGGWIIGIYRAGRREYLSRTRGSTGTAYEEFLTLTKCAESSTHVVYRKSSGDYHGKRTGLKVRGSDLREL